MQESKSPTLSIGPKKPKIFGKPNQSPMLTINMQKSSSPANKSPSVTPQKSNTAESPVLTLSMNSNSSKKERNRKSDASAANKDDFNDYDFDEYSKKSQNTTPSTKKGVTENLSGKGSPHSSISEKDRISVRSTASSKKSSSSLKQKNLQLKMNNSRDELIQSPEVFDEDQENRSEQQSTPVKTKKSEVIDKSPSGYSASSVNKSTSAKSNQQKQPTTPSAPTTPATPGSTNAGFKSNKKNSVNTNKAKASTPNKNNQSKTSNLNSSQKQSKTKNNNNTFSTEDESYDYSPTNSPNRRNKSPLYTKENANPIVKDIIPLVKSLLENNNTSKNNENNKDSNESDIIDESKLSIVSDSLEEWEKTIVSKASPIEEEQIQLWYDSLMELFRQQNIAISKDNKSNENTEKAEPQVQKISYLNDLITKARENISSHRFSLHGEYGHRFKFVVTGPNRSGKSTYLSVLAQQLLYELIACGDWKKTFIFAVDFATIVHVCQDLGLLFTEIARLSIQALCAQRPLLLKYSTSLIEAFSAVVNEKPSVPRTFQLDEDFRLIAPQLQQLLDICYNCYHDSEAMTNFVINTAMLPYFIADVFGGFSNLIVIADHFDLSDVTKTASPPFEDSPDNVFIAEIFKDLFVQGSFIISAKFESALNEVLTSLEVSSSPFSQGIEYLTTYNIVKNNKEKENEENNDEIAFNVSFTDCNDTFVINEESFDGCPLYLSKYDEIKEIGRRIEKGQKQEDDKLSSSRNENNNNNGEEEEIDVEEEKLKIIIKMNEILKLTTLATDGSPYNMQVKDVNLIHKERKQKKTD